MAEYTIIHDVSSRILEVLASATPSGDFGPVTNDPPKDVSAANTKRLSFWLYQVTPNEFLRNQPRRAVPGQPGRESAEPLVLDLHYLLTPMYQTESNAQLHLGSAMQALHSQPRLTVTPSGGAASVEISVALGARTLDELTKVWDSLNEPYRLSVCYDVRLVEIDSRQLFTAPPIHTRGVKEEVGA